MISPLSRGVWQHTPLFCNIPKTRRTTHRFFAILLPLDVLKQEIMKIKNSTLLITGGASGIGKLLAQTALDRGAKAVVIWDINQANIDLTLAELNQQGVVYGYKVDVSDNQEVLKTYYLTKETCGQIDILVNCAGIITSNKTFDLLSEEEIVRTMNINALAPMFVARAIIPDMIKRGKGHICNITSAAGMISDPYMSVYGASKWAATGWSDSLRIEMKKMNKGVKVTTITPYYIKTGMFEGVKSPFIPILKPEYVTKRIIRAIERNTGFRGIPFGIHFIRFWQFILPTAIFDAFFGEVVGLYHAMDNFTGRK